MKKNTTEKTVNKSEELKMLKSWLKDERLCLEAQEELKAIEKDAEEVIYFDLDSDALRILSEIDKETKDGIYFDYTTSKIAYIY